MANSFGFQQNPLAGQASPSMGGQDLLDPPMRRPDHSGLEALINARESGGDYDALFGGMQAASGRFPNMAVSSMSIGALNEFAGDRNPDSYGVSVRNAMKQTKDLSVRWAPDDQRVSTPMGRYQIVGQNLSRLQLKLGLSDDTIFTPALQDRLFRELVKERLAGKTTASSKRKALRLEWEGFKKVSDEDLDAAIAQYETGKGKEELSTSSPAFADTAPTDIKELLDWGDPKLGQSLFDSTQVSQPDIFPDGDVGAFEAVSSSFALENDVWNASQIAVYAIERDAFEHDPEFRLEVGMLNGTVLQHRLDLATDVRSQDELDFVLRWHTRELKHRQIVEAAGWSGVGYSMLAGILSPASLMPFGAGRAVGSVFRGVVKGARAGVGGVATSEAVLQTNQEFRTASESAMGIAGGAILMGAVGGLGGAFGRSQFRRASAQADLLMSDRVQAVVEDGEFSYMSNAAVRQAVREEQERTGHALFSTGDDANSSSRLRQIFREKGDRVKTDDIDGHMDENRRLLVSGSSLDGSRNVIAGFDADIDPKLYKAYHREIMLDREALSGAYDEAVAKPIVPAELTPGQQKLSELEDTPQVRTKVLEERLTEIREQLADRKSFLKRDERRALEDEAQDIQNDLIGLDRAEPEAPTTPVAKSAEVEEPAISRAELDDDGVTTDGESVGGKFVDQDSEVGSSSRGTLRIESEIDDNGLTRLNIVSRMEMDLSRKAMFGVILDVIDAVVKAPGAVSVGGSVRRIIESYQSWSHLDTLFDVVQGNRYGQNIDSFLKRLNTDAFTARIIRYSLENKVSIEESTAINKKNLGKQGDTNASTTPKAKQADEASPEGLAKTDEALEQAGRQVDTGSSSGKLSDAGARALGPELVEEFGIVNGMIRELTDLYEVLTPSPTQRARMVYLRRQFSEWASEAQYLRLQRIYKRHNMDDTDLKQMFNHPLRGSVFEDIIVLEKLEAGGDVRSRVDRLMLNDKELHGINYVPDPSPVRSIKGIGAKLEERLASFGIENVGDLKQHLLNGGEASAIIKGKLKDRILGAETPGTLGEAHVPLESTPMMRAAEAAWGFNNLPLMISTPQGRIMMRSTSPVAHRIMANLIITDYKLTRNYQGIESEEPVELGIKNWQLKISRTMSQVEDLRRKYMMSVRFDSPETPGRVKTFAKRFTDDEVANRHKILPQSRWWVEVTKALRHEGQAGLLVPKGAVKHVEEAARLVREQIWGPAAKEFGFLTSKLNQKGVNPMSYVFRAYDVVAVRNNQPKMHAAMLEDVLKNWRNKYESSPKPEQLAEISETIDKWIDGILTEPHMRSAPNLAEVTMEGKSTLGRGSRKRVVEVSDDVLEPYLQHDLRDIISAYMHTRLPDLELKNKFGDVRMASAFDQLDTQYLEAISKAPESIGLEESRGLNPASHLQARPRTKAELEAQWVSDRKDLENMRDIMRHTYALPADPYTWKGYGERGMKMLRDVNFLRIGGGFAITALGDVGGMVLVNGAARTMGDIVGELADGLGRANQAVPLAKADIDALQLSWNDVMNQRAVAWAGVGEYGGAGYTALERALARNSKKMATVSLLQPWTNYMKQIAARGVMSRMIEVAEAVEKGSFDPDALAAISRAYMSKEELLQVLELYRIHGGEEGGARWLGIEKWQDTDNVKGITEMKRLVRNVIITDVDRAIMTPGAGDSPIFMHSTAGKFLLQFKRFGVAHTQKLLVPAMQGAKAGNLAIMNVAAISIAMGAVVYSLKELANKREVPTDIGRILQEGVVRSDLWGSLGEMDGLSSAVSDGNLGFRQMLGPDTYHSYHGQNYFDNVASVALGPSYSTMVEGGKALSGAIDAMSGDGMKSMTAGQIRAFRRMMPYQNIFYLDFLFDAVQNGVESAGKREARFKALANGMKF